MIIYTDRFIPARFQAITVGFVILIRPECRSDIGLLYHERTHVRQFVRTFGLMAILYWLSPRHRLAYEVEAYRNQLQAYPDDKSQLFANMLATNYNISITADEALRLLRRT